VTEARGRGDANAAAQSDLFPAESAAGNLRAALAKAYRLLGIRARSESELHQALARAGYGEAVIAQTLAECKRQHFVDDADFALQFLQSRLRQRPTGRLRLQVELQQKGIAPEIIAAALDEVFATSETSTQLADQLAEKLRRRLAALPAQKARQRLADHLRRRGFDWEAVQQTKLWRELEKEN